MLMITYVWLFVLCYFGDQVTSAFENLHESIYMCDWHLFPLELKKYITPMLLLAHENVYMHGFYEFDCTLQVFEQVIPILLQIILVVSQKYAILYRLSTCRTNISQYYRI